MFFTLRNKLMRKFCIAYQVPAGSREDDYLRGVYYGSPWSPAKGFCNYDSSYTGACADTVRYWFPKGWEKRIKEGEIP